MRTVSPAAGAKLFMTGFTVGPVVDSLHNQCLLRYGILPIAVQSPNPWDDSDPLLFCSSWVVPPLLGIAYVVLGGVLPKILEAALPSQQAAPSGPSFTAEGIDGKPSPPSTGAASPPVPASALRNRAVLAVCTTAMIIKLSEYLQVHPLCTDRMPFFGTSPLFVDHPGSQHLAVMVAAALLQWALLDRTAVALLAATAAAVVGPLSELPFVAHGFWQYLDGAADYLPLQDLVFPGGIGGGVVAAVGSLLDGLLGGDYQRLALSSITGPCYFAVTTDAIALGRWLDCPAGGPPPPSETTTADDGNPRDA